MVVGPAEQQSWRRQQRRSANTRDRILKAALEAFANHGFDGAMTRDIAHSAGVHQPVINYHVDCKEGLWKAAVSYAFDRLRQSFVDELRKLQELQEMQVLDARKKLEMLVRRFVLFSAELPELSRLMVQEGVSPGPRLEWIVERHMRPFFATTLELIQETQSGGSLAPIPPVNLYYMLLGAASTIFIMAPTCRLLGGVDPMTEAMRQAHANAVIDLFFPRTVDAA
jgi:TetR/AcrR family transcriptional regulator